MKTIKNILKRKTCKDCGQNLVKIQYGFPSHETFKKADEGKVILGGCMVMPGAPTFGCPDCFYKED